VETLDALGTAPASSITKARELFLRIRTKYAGEDNAPGALLKLGMIGLDPVNPQRNLDEAYAAFSGVVNIYPTSAMVDRALMGAGYADFLAARYDKAAGSFQRVAEEFPRGAVAEDAHYYQGLALARQGSWIRAIEELQEVRDLYPSGRLGAQALDMTTRIYKMKVQPAVTGRPLFVIDGAFSATLPGEAGRAEAGLAVDGASVVHLLDARSGEVLRFDHEGKPRPGGVAMPGAVGVSVDAAGVELLAAGGK